MTKSEFKDVEAYIAGAAVESRPALKELRRIIKATLPEAAEEISWGVPFYRYHGALGGFAVYQKHVSFGTAAAVLQSDDRRMLKEQGYVTGKKTIQIRFDQEVPAAAIKQMLKAQAKLNEV